MSRSPSALSRCLESPPVAVFTTYLAPNCHQSGRRALLRKRLYVDAVVLRNLPFAPHMVVFRPRLLDLALIELDVTCHTQLVLRGDRPPVVFDGVTSAAEHC